ncbi:MAG: hypothetical protein C5B59_02905 [Bacteroidetes bacterium]|nr:MAG: hypothetical protein C5B59_02905 [Bacteroidota bacterium]
MDISWPKPDFRNIFIFFLTICSLTDKAQKADVFHLDKITAGDFNIKSPLIDTGTGAVILADVGISSIENIDNQWKLVYKCIRRVKILSKTGFDNLTQTLSFSAEDNGNGKLKSLKATTYNLVDGKVEATPLADKEFFLETSKNSNRVVEKFTFPNAKIGSIVEYSYTKKYWDIATIPTWEFQRDYPVLWSEYSIIIPDNFNYAVSKQGNLPFYETSSDSASKEIWNGRGNIEVLIFTKRWAMKDVPPLKEESFVYDKDSYRSRIDFQLSYYPRNNLSSASFYVTWEQASRLMLSRRRLGPVVKDSLWLRFEVKNIVSNSVDSLEKARKLFAYVRDTFRCNDEDWWAWDSDLQRVFYQREGSKGELNLLLLEMLRNAGFHAYPVALSTRSNGLLNSKYPVMDKVDYVVVQLLLNKHSYYLDASTRFSAFGKIPFACYNGSAMVIDTIPYIVNFPPDSAKENSMRTIFIYNVGKDSLEADCSYNPGYNESAELRKWMQNNKTSDYFADVTKSYLFQVRMKSQSVDNLKAKDEPASIHYTVDFSVNNDQTVYFDPLIGQLKVVNPFIASVRKYPVQLQNCFNKAYVLDMELPKGYQVEELPKSTKVLLNDGDGSFEYSMAMADGHIQFRYRLSLNKAVFSPEDYESLRNFFATVTKKESEMIVFKKIH